MQAERSPAWTVLSLNVDDPIRRCPAASADRSIARPSLLQTMILDRGNYVCMYIAAEERVVPGLSPAASLIVVV